MLLRGRSTLRLLPMISCLLVACTINKPPGLSLNSPEWKQHQQDVSKLTQYQTRGAFAYKSKEQSVYARFNWQQTAPDRYRLLLINPLGNTELQLDVQGSVVQLVDNKGKRYVSNNAEKMLSELTGMDIPLDNLRQWMIGLPGDANQYQLDSQGQLNKLNYRDQQRNWTVSYLSYDTKTTPSLPSSLKLEEGDRLIKLRVDTWKIQ